MVWWHSLCRLLFLCSRMHRWLNDSFLRCWFQRDLWRGSFCRGRSVGFWNHQAWLQLDIHVSDFMEGANMSWVPSLCYVWACYVQLYFTHGKLSLRDILVTSWLGIHSCLTLSFCSCSVVRHGWGRILPGAVARIEVIMTAPGGVCVLLKDDSFCPFRGGETGCMFSKDCFSRRSLGRSMCLLWALKSLVPTT